MACLRIGQVFRVGGRISFACCFLVSYVLLESIRRLYLRTTELARSQVSTIRLKLLKIGGVVIRNTRRVQILLSSNYSYQSLFAKIAARFTPG